MANKIYLLTYLLTIMFNLSLREGTVPHEWKACQCSAYIQKWKPMQSRKLQTGKINISSMQTPRIITARSYDRFPRKPQFIKEYAERISKRTVVFDKLVRIYENNIKVGR